MPPENTLSGKRKNLNPSHKNHDGNPHEETVEFLLSWGRKELGFLEPQEAATDVEILIGKILGATRAEIYLAPKQSLSAVQVELFRAFIERRKKREPTAYLTGQSSFWQERIQVGPGCLVPRPETEILIERFVDFSGYSKKDSFSFLDLGAGSGAIGIALLRHFENARAVFSDISEKALQWTRKNLHVFSLEERSEVILSDLFGRLKGRRFDAIVCNPPYLSYEDMQRKQPELEWEPCEALAGGPDGLVFYRRIAQEALAYLSSEGRIVFEVGIHQAANVVEILREHPFQDIRVFKDHLGVDRVVMAKINS